jgi:hypothetical protein
MSNIRRLGRIDTGRMINSLQARAVRTGPVTQYIVSATARSKTGFNYPLVQEAGSRGHGPVRAKMLAFTPKGSNQVVFAKYVRGVTAGRFMADAVRDTRASDAVG